MGKAIKLKDATPDEMAQELIDRDCHFVLACVTDEDTGEVMNSGGGALPVQIHILSRLQQKVSERLLLSLTKTPDLR